MAWCRRVPRPATSPDATLTSSGCLIANRSTVSNSTNQSARPLVRSPRNQPTSVRCARESSCTAEGLARPGRSRREPALRGRRSAPRDRDSATDMRLGYGLQTVATGRGTRRRHGGGVGGEGTASPTPPLVSTVIQSASRAVCADCRQDTRCTRCTRFGLLRISRFIGRAGPRRQHADSESTLTPSHCVTPARPPCGARGANAAPTPNRSESYQNKK